MFHALIFGNLETLAIVVAKHILIEYDKTHMTEPKAKHSKAATVAAQIASWFRDFLAKKPNFYGSVQVNFHDGDVPNMNVLESVKLGDKTQDS